MSPNRGLLLATLTRWLRWLRRHWHWPVVAFNLTAAALLVSYMLWAMNDIPQKITNAEIVNVGVVRLPCGKAHFWGNEVLYNVNGRGVYWGRACRDWSGERWILNDGNEP